jgi:enoyl-CoA hydratase/carnithine racemase
VAGTGDPISAQRGYEVGLVNEVVPLADLRSRAQQLAERIGRAGGGARDPRGNYLLSRS